MILRPFRRWKGADRCPHCFSRYLPGTQVCPFCAERFKAGARGPGTREGVLPAGTVLNGRYRLGDALARTEESVLYAAWDQRRRCQAFIRGFLPRDGQEEPPEAGTAAGDGDESRSTGRDGFFSGGVRYVPEDAPPRPAEEAEAGPPPLRCRAAVWSDAGSRAGQEDAADVITGGDFACAVLCDGMGGMGHGGVASALCLEALMGAHQSLCFAPLPALLPLLQRTVRQADRQIAQLRDASGRRLGCGTTLVCAVLRQGALYYASVGDSRLYLVRGGSIRQLNREHTLRQLLRDREEPEPPEEGPCWRGDALTSYMGVGGLPQLDITEEPLPLEAGDAVLLCSDGLYRALTDGELLDLLGRQASPEDAARALIAAALDKQLPHQDNLTAVVVRYGPEAGKEMSL